MKLKLPLTIFAVLALGGLGAYLIVHQASPAAAAPAHSAPGADPAGEIPKGPHGGKLFRDGAFTTELAIHEVGGPPEFRAWFTQDGKPVAPASVTFSVQLTRPDAVVDRHTFSPQGAYLRGAEEVYEPHSFTYLIRAEHAGRSYQWELAAPEMQTTISVASARLAGIDVEAAGPATLPERIPAYGQIKLNGDKIARVVPRFGGVVREARKSLGDSVQQGEVVAVLESNESLSMFEVKAPIAGTILERDTMAGEAAAAATALYTIADLSEVWVDLHVQKGDQGRVKLGQPVAIQADDGGPEAVGQIAWMSPLGSVASQTLVARVVLPNPEGRWRPGLFVKAAITVAEIAVPVAVKESGVQTLFSFTVVFSRHGELYQARPLEIGRRSGGYVEVLKGLRAGELYVTANSFLIKADIGKSGATHDH